jgi:hypothetical protein
VAEDPDDPKPKKEWPPETEKEVLPMANKARRETKTRGPKRKGKR